MNRSPGKTLVVTAVLWAVAVAVTTAGFFTFIVTPERGTTFYAVWLYTCFAELVLFGYAAYLMTVPHTVTRPSPAVRNRTMVMIVIWFIVILAMGCIAVHPNLRDTFYSDKVIFFQVVLTFLLLLGAYFMHRQDVGIQVAQEQPERERVRLQAYSGAVQAAVDVIKELGSHNPDRLVLLERAEKRLETLKSVLLSASPVAERDRERLVSPVSTEEVESGLRKLNEALEVLKTSSQEDFEGAVTRVRETADRIIAALRHREETIRF
jgi:hypothetical protein